MPKKNEKKPQKIAKRNTTDIEHHTTAAHDLSLKKGVRKELFT